MPKGIKKDGTKAVPPGRKKRVLQKAGPFNFETDVADQLALQPNTTAYLHAAVREKMERDQAAAAEYVSEFEPQQWAVGDLCQTVEGERFLVLGFEGVKYGNGICLMEYGEVNTLRLDQVLGQKHNTGLEYEWQNARQARRQFKDGFFTPYFEIL